MEDNLIIYNQLREVPEEAQKKITGGRLNGMTDIKPMWRIEKLTEVFGPVGLGWYTKTLNKQIVDGANGEKIAIVDIELYVNYKKFLGEDEEDTWSNGIEGSGGSSFIAKEKNGLYTNDECFKMAYTDALSVACKSLGMGANVYWGDSKYNTNEITEEDAREFRFPEKSKAPNMTILEAYEKNKKYLEWYINNGPRSDIKTMIQMLTDIKPTDVPQTEEDQNKKLLLIEQLNKLIFETGSNYANMLKHYKVKTNAEMTIEQLEDAINKLKKRGE